VTLPPLRLQGVGGAMVDKMETEARARGVRAIYLLTGDSVEFFARLGYAPCARERVPAAIAATGQFAGLATATVMMKQV
jgi:N-acetylglutamate synthase-like GNAT family acetyltransferase